MGFALAGNRDWTRYGIYLDGAGTAPVRDVTVRNGFINGFGYGSYCEYAINSRFEHLTTSSNAVDGVYLYCDTGQCNGNTMADCTMSSNDGYGINLYGNSGLCEANTIANCLIRGNNGGGVGLSGVSGQCMGNKIANCVISGNGSYGVTLSGSFGQCAGNTVTDCMIWKNVYRGIFVSYASGNRIEGNHVSGQTGTPTEGIYTFASTNNLICTTFVWAIPTTSSFPLAIPTGRS